MGTDNDPEIRISEISHSLFGVDESIVGEALLHSPNARGYILGALSELLLKRALEAAGFEVLRIKEKWEGPKMHHGDFYISRDGQDWFVVESKGLKSNSEKWAGTSGKSYYEKLLNSKRDGAESQWFKDLPPESKELIRLEENQSQFRLCQTHMPSGKATNANKTNGRSQASPRFDEFHLLAVDMFSKTGRHEFVYAVSDSLSRSTKDSNHLLQNYFITLVLPSNLRPVLPLATPWSTDLLSLVDQLKSPVLMHEMQIDEREPGGRAEGVISF
jgi:hypothetical protein